MGIFNNIKQGFGKAVSMVQNFVGLRAEAVSYSNPKYKRTTTASRRAAQKALDDSRYLHVSCPPQHNRLNKALGLTRGVSYVK